MRSPQELYEIVSIIGEILPNLPQSGIFEIDETLRKTSITHQHEPISWQWKDENEIWRPYTVADSRTVEVAFIQGDDECVINTMGRTYVVDFGSMLQINEETGTARPVARKPLNGSNIEGLLKATNNNNNNNELVINKNVVTNFNEAQMFTNLVKDYRLDYLSKKPMIYAEFVNSLFPILYEVYSSSAGPSIKHTSLRSLLRLIFYSSRLPALNPDAALNNESKSNVLLYDLLCHLPISSHIASMLASNDTKIIVSALQISEILMQNLPDIFAIYFQREGVIYQIDKLIESTTLVVQKAAAHLKNISLANASVESSDAVNKNKNSTSGK